MATTCSSYPLAHQCTYSTIDVEHCLSASAELLLNSIARLFVERSIHAVETTICVRFGLNDKLARPIVHLRPDSHLWNSSDPVGKERCNLAHADGHVERRRCFCTRILLYLFTIIALVRCVFMSARGHSATMRLAGCFLWHVDLQAYRIAVWRQ